MVRNGVGMEARGWGGGMVVRKKWGGQVKGCEGGRVIEN